MASPPGPGATVAEYLEYDLATHVAGLKPATASNYRRAYRQWWAPAIGHIRLAALTLADIQGAMDGRGRLAPGTVRMYAGLLSAALGRAVLNRALDRNPATSLRLPRMRPSSNRGLSQDELARWLAAALAPAGLGGLYWYGPMMATAPLTGLRHGELRGLRWDSVELWDRPERDTAGVIAVCEQIASYHGGGDWEPPKSAASHRTVPLTVEAARILAIHRDRVASHARRAGTRAWHEYDLVFPSRVGTPAATGAVAETRERIALLAGVDPTPTFHALRHTYASLLVDGGMSPAQVAKLLGHADQVLCIRQYYDPTPAAHDAATAAIRARWSLPDRRGRW